MRNSRGHLYRRVGKSAKIIQSKLVNFVRCIAVVVVVVTELREHNLVAFAIVLIMFSIVMMMMMTNIIMLFGALRWATKQFSVEEVACNYAQFVDVYVCVCMHKYLSPIVVLNTHTHTHANTLRSFGDIAHVAHGVCAISSSLMGDERR